LAGMIHALAAAGRNIRSAAWGNKGSTGISCECQRKSLPLGVRTKTWT